MRQTRLLLVRKKISFAGAVCQITQRAPGREKLFIEEKDYLYLLFLLKKYSDEFNFSVMAFVLMKNHLHFLIELNQDNLSKAMEKLFGTYARNFNTKYKRKGHVFCGPFRQALSLEDIYTLTASIYIHNNPVVARLTKKATEYKWSSASNYINLRKSFISKEKVLRIISSDLKIAKVHYEEILSQTRKADYNCIDLKPKEFRDYCKLVKIIASKNLHLKNKVFNLSTELDKKIDEIVNSGRLRKAESMLARKYLIEQLLANGLSVKQIAEHLGISAKSVYNTLNFTKLTRLEM